MSRIRFIVFSSPRSGSTALREALHRHNGVTCCGEIFGKNRILSLPRHLLGATGAELLDERNADPAAFAERVFSAGRDPAIGFKLLPSQIVTLENASLFRLILEDTAIRIVFLWRRDLARRYISERKFLEAGRRGGSEDEGDLVIDTEDMRADCRRYANLRRAMRTILMREHFAEVYYEDLAANDPQAFKSISDLLELSEPLAGLGDENTDRRNRGTVRVANEQDLLDRCAYTIGQE